MEIIYNELNVDMKMVLTLELELPAQISSMSPLSSDLFSVPPVARPTLLPRPGPRQS